MDFGCTVDMNWPAVSKESCRSRTSWFAWADIEASQPSVDSCGVGGGEWESEGVMLGGRWGVRSEDLLPGQHATSGYNLNIPPSQHNLQQINNHPALQKIHYPTYYLRDNKIAVKTIFNCMIYFFLWILTLF